MHLDVTLKAESWIEPEKFLKQIADAGYEARKDDVRLTLRGKLDKDGDRLILTLDDVQPGPQKFVVTQGESKKEKEAKDFADAYAQAQGLVGKAVEIEGYWKPADKKKVKEALPGLTVTRIAEFKPKTEPAKPNP